MPVIEYPVIWPLIWMGNSKENIQSFPEEAQKMMGDQIQLIQFGGMPTNAKPFKDVGRGVSRSPCFTTISVQGDNRRRS